jgi:hypothetical protein
MGLSALELSRDGTRFLALSDRGWLLSGKMERAEGRLTGVDLKPISLFSPLMGSLLPRGGWGICPMQKGWRPRRLSTVRCGSLSISGSQVCILYGSLLLFFINALRLTSAARGQIKANPAPIGGKLRGKLFSCLLFLDTTGTYTVDMFHVLDTGQAR